MGEAQVSDEEFRKRFELARARCLTGHGAGCSYGGLSPSGGYWLAVDRCPVGHGDECAVCGGEAHTVFVGWHDGVSRLEQGTVGGLIWGVTVCAACRDRELALNPEKWGAVMVHAVCAGVPEEEEPDREGALSP